MYIDSHLERCVLVQTVELYRPGKYLNWNLNFIDCETILLLAMENSIYIANTYDWNLSLSLQWEVGILVFLSFSSVIPCHLELTIYHLTWRQLYICTVLINHKSLPCLFQAKFARINAEKSISLVKKFQKPHNIHIYILHACYSTFP